MKNKKLLLLPVLILMFSLTFISSAFTGAGSGTEGDPYQITTCVQLQEMIDELTADYILMNNIDCSDTVNWNAGAGFEPCGTGGGSFGYFYGTFNGQGYSISNLYINRPTEDFIGIFGSYGGNFISANLVDVDITGQDQTGGAIGYAEYSGTTLDINVTGIVTGRTNVGGIVGTQNNGGLDTCSFNGIVIGNNSVGGITGASAGDIINSNVNADIYYYTDGGLLYGWTDGGRTFENNIVSGNLIYGAYNSVTPPTSGGILNYDNLITPEPEEETPAPITGDVVTEPKSSFSINTFFQNILNWFNGLFS